MSVSTPESEVNFECLTNYYIIGIRKQKGIEIFLDPHAGITRLTIADSFHDFSLQDRPSFILQEHYGAYELIFRIAKWNAEFLLGVVPPRELITVRTTVNFFNEKTFHY